MYNMMELYEREAVKATDQLYDLISSSDVPLDMPINWRDAAVLGPPFLRFLCGFFEGCLLDSLIVCCLGDRFSYYLCFSFVVLRHYRIAKRCQPPLVELRALESEGTGQSEAQWFPFVCLILGTNCVPCNRFSCNYGVVMRMNVVFSVF